MSESTIWPAKVEVPPCLVAWPVRSATKFVVTASVLASLAKSPAQTKQTRLVPSKAPAVIGEAGPAVATRRALGALSQVLNEA